MFTGSMHNLKYVTSQGPSKIRIPSITTIPVARNPSAAHGPTECRQCLHLYFVSHKTCHRKNYTFVSSEVLLVRVEQSCQQYPAEQDSDRNWPWPVWSWGILWRNNQQFHMSAFPSLPFRVSQDVPQKERQFCVYWRFAGSFGTKLPTVSCWTGFWQKLWPGWSWGILWRHNQQFHTSAFPSLPL